MCWIFDLGEREKVRIVEVKDIFVLLKCRNGAVGAIGDVVSIICRSIDWLKTRDVIAFKVGGDSAP